MTVKVGNTLSEPQSVTGGAPGVVQGSVLGVLDHNLVMERVDEEFVSDSHKYVDDLTTTEKSIMMHDGVRKKGRI